MGIFERAFCFLIYTFFAYVMITSMGELGEITGFEQMKELGVAIIFGAVYMHLMIMDEKKKDKKEEKDEVD